MADRPLLSVEGVCRDFGSQLRTRVLDHIDLRIDRGELVALVGPSGSGKSTLLNIIGLLDRPTSGRVVLAGTDTSGLDDGGLTAMRAHTLGFIFQFHHLLPAFTALENVLLPAWGEVGWATRAMRAEAAELLVAVGLAERMNYRITQLSGGQQQRVAIARALSRRPQLVLADEPTGNLDTESATEVFELMRRQNVERGTTFIVVTHDSRIADRCARTVEIVDGRITAPGSGGTAGARVIAGHSEPALISPSPSPSPSLPSSGPPAAALVVR